MIYQQRNDNQNLAESKDSTKFERVLIKMLRQQSKLQHSVRPIRFVVLRDKTSA